MSHHHLSTQLNTDPKLYYESVPPSDWRPDPSDSYLSLYHRAYCNVMDVLVPPLVFASMAALANVMPMLLLLPTTPFVFVGITFCCLTKGITRAWRSMFYRARTPLDTLPSQHRRCWHEPL